MSLFTNHTTSDSKCMYVQILLSKNNLTVKEARIVNPSADGSWCRALATLL